MIEDYPFEVEVPEWADDEDSAEGFYQSLDLVDWQPLEPEPFAEVMEIIAAHEASS